MKCKRCGELYARQPRLLELIIGFVAAATPFWMMANDWSDMDEVVKSGVGVAFLSAIVVMYKVWKGKS